MPSDSLIEQRLPCSPLGGLRLWWNSVLFPGASATSSGWSWTGFVVVGLLPALLLYPCLSFRLFEPDEGRYAQIPREMLESGEWIVPTLQGKPYLDKPPLFYWLVMSSFAVFGFHDWAARIVPGLAVHATVVAAYLFGRRLLGERAALLGALVLTAAPGFAGMGRLLLLDGLLTLWVTIALGAGFLSIRSKEVQRGWWLLMSLACGLGMLTKGPVAIILVLPPLLLFRLMTGTGAWPRRRDWLVFGSLLFAINAPWYGAVCWRLPEFARYFFWEHNVLRFLQPFDHERPVWFYVPIVLVGWLPGTLLMRPLFRFFLSSDDADGRPAELGFLVLCAAWCLAFFSLAGCKLPTYILPAFPPLSLALGAVLSQRLSRWSRGVLGTCFALVLMLHVVFVPWLAEYRSPMVREVDVLRTCSDPAVPVFCFPRNIDSASFYLGRADFVSYRSKQIDMFLDHLRRCPKAVVLFSHRHSLELVRSRLGNPQNIVHEAPLGLCDLAIIERTGEPGASAAGAQCTAVKSSH